MESETPLRYEGGCHCGAVRFRVTVRAPSATRLLDCNCSICTKKGFLHLIVTREDFELLQGEGSLTEYRFNTGAARHLFCRTCGMHPFYVPRSHPDGVDVNARCLDAALAELPLPVEPFDGRDWEASVDSIR